jgi:hypothetical protein
MRRLRELVKKRTGIGEEGLIRSSWETCSVGGVYRNYYIRKQIY